MVLVTLFSETRGPCWLCVWKDRCGRQIYAWKEIARFYKAAVVPDRRPWCWSSGETVHSYSANSWHTVVAMEVLCLCLLSLHCHSTPWRKVLGFIFILRLRVMIRVRRELFALEVWTRLNHTNNGDTEHFKSGQVKPTWEFDNLLLPVEAVKDWNLWLCLPDSFQVWLTLAWVMHGHFSLWKFR